jgi:hypothetical protein
VFIEFHPFFFLIKDQVTRKIIHRGRCVGGLYLLISSRCRHPSLPSMLMLLPIPHKQGGIVA